jgi:hypothetical protein
MKKTFFILLLAALWFVGCDVRKADQKFKLPGSETEQVADTNPPTKVQIIDTVYNFGQVKEGELVEYSYRFKNIGDKPLVISSAKASCGCTVPEKPEKPIAPGEIGTIKVKFDSKGRPGQAQKSITVISNALPSFPPLILEGEVLGKPEEDDKKNK